uniref:Uncharacterized protein n=1 Tax=viral metagenome TaxID=1070528 RepID=A0A6C0FDQ9_9ZZZZ|tara:strand:+ start:2828 stop:3538 length:711 start_codon:yes stop_codon:yes gene_type:complete
MKSVTFSPVVDEENPVHKLSQEIQEKKKNRNDCVCYLVSLIALLCLIVFYLLAEDQGGGISARLYGHSPHKLTCDDMEFGCCKLFTDCSKKIDHISYRVIHLSPYRISSHDNFMSNCPSLETLINKYNRHYGNISTDCGEFGCCPGLNVGCDNTIRHAINDGNNEETLDYYDSHQKTVPIKINKVDKVGSNCYDLNRLSFDIKNSYEQHYPSKEGDTWTVILIILIVICCFLSSLD